MQILRGKQLIFSNTKGLSELLQLHLQQVHSLSLLQYVSATLTLAWSRGKNIPRPLFFCSFGTIKDNEMRLVTSPEYDRATKWRLSHCFFAPELPIWRPQTGSNEKFSFNDSNY
jgi:hypothetical protein